MDLRRFMFFQFRFGLWSRSLKRVPSLALVTLGATSLLPIWAASAQQTTPHSALLSQSPATGFKWESDTNGAFVTALCRDEKTGVIWVGVEDQGVYRYDPNAAPEDEVGSGKWENFRVPQTVYQEDPNYNNTYSLGDNNAYALSLDHQGRLWVGTRNHGVSVYNGQGWRTYDALTGPLGERVFKIAVSPVDGDVWIATNRGLTRYSQKSDAWRTFTRLDGLPSDQIQALAFAEDGTLFVGTQCDGLAIGKAGDDYKIWGSVPGPQWMPNAARGTGLPSALINDILVAKGGTVYVATDDGLARSQNNGKSWLYLRGRNYADKIKGQYERPHVPDLREVSDENMSADERANLLLEDTVTTLAEDERGRIWLGHPQAGVECRTPGAEEFAAGGVVETPSDFRTYWAKRGKLLSGGMDQDERSDYVTAILPRPGDAPLVAAYGSGVIPLQGDFFKGDAVPLSTPMVSAKSESAAPLPAFASLSSIEELQALTRQVKALPAANAKVAASFLGEDWQTQGNWVGRYGTRSAFLCAMNAPLDQVIVNDLSYTVSQHIGPHPALEGHNREEESLRHWLHRVRWDDRRVLYNPILGYRREADNDDHGETYPASYEGPDIWVAVHVPEGEHRVSLYFFNKDGQVQNNRVRDYLIEIKKGHNDPYQSIEEPTIARCRVRDFWGGTWKQFQVRGPGDYYVVVRKNNSFNAVLQTVMLDKLSGPPTKYENSRDIWASGDSDQPMAPRLRPLCEEAVLSLTDGQKRLQLQAAIDLWNALDGAYDKDGATPFQLPGRLLAYRVAHSIVAEDVMGPNKAFMQWWRQMLPLWTPSDDKQWNINMAADYKRITDLHPDLKALAQEQ